MVLAVIPNYNGGETVLRCIDSLKRQSYPDIRITVVDNASSDGSPAAIRARHPDVDFVETGYNAGWGVACNIGMRRMDSRYIALLNNDAWLDKDCVKEMVRAIERSPDYGSCASKILLGDDPARIEVCGLVIAADGSSCGRGRLEPSDRYGRLEEVFCANDCVCLYKREMIRQIGDYDPDFFIYCDETDMGFRHQIAGWKCVYTPAAVAYHAHSRSAGSYSSFKAYHVERNRIFLLLKYFPWPMLIRGFFLSLVRYGWQVALSASSRKGTLARYLEGHSLFTGLAVLLKAHWHALRKAPVMLRRRAAMQGLWRISPGEFRDLFRRFGISVKTLAAYE